MMMRASSVIVMFLALIVCLATASNACARDVRAAFFEYADGWTSLVGLEHALELAGFEAIEIKTDGGIPAGVDLIVIGSFATEDSAYRDWQERHADRIERWVRAGGVFLELTQADQTAQLPAFLEENEDISAARTDSDAGPVVLLDRTHPLVSALPLRPSADTPVMSVASSFRSDGSWENWSEQRGMRVLAGVGTDPTREPVLLEGSIGTGRVILSSFYFDKLHDADVNEAAPLSFRSASAGFFSGLRRYVELVSSSQAPRVVPTEPYIPPAPLAFVPGSYTFVALPDTQVYSRAVPETFVVQTEWIVEHAEERNIAMVLHEGDITDWNNPEQWENARRAMHILHGEVPYIMSLGNHDLGPGGNGADRTTLFNDYFPLSEQRQQPTFGGTHEEGNSDNSYHLFEAGGTPWIAIALEFGPRDSVVEWLDELLAEHADRAAIIVTHAYMFNDETRYAWSLGKRQSWNPYYYGIAKHPDGTNDGEDLWQKVLRKHANVAFVLSGHVLGDGTGLLSSEGDHGNTVHQMLANYQIRPGGGEGFLRLIEILPDGGTVQVRSYSPLLDRYLTEDDQQFTLELDVHLK